MVAEVIHFFEKDSSTVQYVVVCPETKKCAVIDCVLEFSLHDGNIDTSSIDKIKLYIDQNKLDLQWILETHVHADHITGAAYLKTCFPKAKLGIGSEVLKVQHVFKNIFHFDEKNFKHDGSQFDHLFKDNEVFQIGNLSVQVLHTPGHTPACVCYYINNDCVFVGDTIFMPDQGTARCDFPEGNAETLWYSIQRIFSLPEQTRVFVCHDYQPGGRELKWETTIKEEKEKNIHVKNGTSKEQFIKWRTERDATLSVPKLIIPSTQVNVNAGYFPPHESDGHVYLKLPIDVFKPKGTRIVTMVQKVNIYFL